MALDAASRHQPVMLDRCVALLSPALEHDGAICIDATLGMGGHAEAVLRGTADRELGAPQQEPSPNP